MGREASPRLISVWCRVCARFVGDRQHPHETIAWEQLRLPKWREDTPTSGFYGRSHDSDRTF